MWIIVSNYTNTKNGNFNNKSTATQRTSMHSVYPVLSSNTSFSSISIILLQVTLQQSKIFFFACDEQAGTTFQHFLPEPEESI